MSDKVDPYNLHPLFERAAVTYACTNEDFFRRVGYAIDPDALKNPVGQLALQAAQAVARELGHPPGSGIVVLQRLADWMHGGKATFEQINAVEDLLDGASDAGLPPVEQAASELVRVVRRRLQHVAVRTAQAEYSAKKDFAAVVNIINKANALGGDQKDASPKAVLTAIEAIEAKRIDWLWGGRIPRGMVTLVEGLPDVGKSVLSMDTAARVSTGTAMPGETEQHEPADVVVLSGEDDSARTIRPRLEAAGADLSRCHVIRMRAPDGSEHFPDIDPADLAECEARIVERGARLFVVDPLFAFLPPKVDAHKDAHVRRALVPVHGLAERTGCAVMVIRHPRKNNANAPAVLAGGGSIGITAAARSVLLVARDPEDDTGNRRILAVAKHNLAGPTPSLEFEIEETFIGELAISTAHVLWGGQSHFSADQLVQPAQGPEQKSAVDEAWDFLGQAVPTWRPVREVQAEARQAGVSWDSVRRAMKARGVKPRKRPGKDGPWELPPIIREGEQVPPPSESSPPSPPSVSSPDSHCPNGGEGEEGKEGGEDLKGGEGPHLPRDAEVSS